MSEHLEQSQRPYSRPDLLHLRFRLDPTGEVPSRQDVMKQQTGQSESATLEEELKKIKHTSEPSATSLEQKAMELWLDRMPKEIKNRFRAFARDIKEALDRGDLEAALAEWGDLQRDAQERIAFNESLDFWRNKPSEDYFSAQRKGKFEELVARHFGDEVLSAETEKQTKRNERNSQPRSALKRLGDWIYDRFQDLNSYDFTANWKRDERGEVITTLVGGLGWSIGRYLQALINLHRNEAGKLRPAFALRNDDLTVDENGIHFFNPDAKTREDRRTFLWTDDAAEQLNFVIDSAWIFDFVNWLRRFSKATADKPIFPYGTLRIEEAGGDQVFAEILLKRPDLWQAKIEKLVNAMSSYQKHLIPPNDLQERDEFDAEKALDMLSPQVKKQLLVIVKEKLSGKSMGGWTLIDRAAVDKAKEELGSSPSGNNS